MRTANLCNLCNAPVRPFCTLGLHLGVRGLQTGETEGADTWMVSLSLPSSMETRKGACRVRAALSCKAAGLP